MTREEKDLLLKDLCGRLPYRVVALKTYKEGSKTMESTSLIETDDIDMLLGTVEDMEEAHYTIKPYLRPMSSMTEEEKEEYDKTFDWDYSIQGTPFDWLNKHHFDYRGLIKKGLALEAPEGMYDKEEPEEESEIPIPKTVDEAVKTLAKILSKEDRDYILENGAISVHHSLGTWIRNEWGLWTGSELKNELMNMNKGLNHPDDMSNYIIEEFIKYWNNKL